MTSWLTAAVVGILAAAFQYGALRAPAAAIRVALGALRALAVTLVVALLLDAPMGRPRAMLPAVFVDGSLSMSRENAGLERVAWDSALAIHSDSLWMFGDSVERVPRERSAPVPSQSASRVRPIVERAMATRRPLVLITDGEVQDSAALDGLPSGSRVIVLRREPRRDVALVSMDPPRAAVEGDSVAVRVTIAA